MESRRIRIEAEREFVLFLQEYSSLLAAHISSIRAVMGETTEKVMDSILKISKATEQKKELAGTVLVKRIEGDIVANSIQGDDATFKNAKVDLSEADFSNKTTVDRLKGHMQGLDSLDASMQEVLFKMVGTLSVDDVVGQRLDHVSSGLTSLQNALGQILDKEGHLLGVQDMTELLAEVLVGTRKSYTMPEEHAVLDDVFGRVATFKS